MTGGPSINIGGVKLDKIPLSQLKSDSGEVTGGFNLMMPGGGAGRKTLGMPGKKLSSLALRRGAKSKY